ncbi:hypothetical protein GOBAR_DD26954 [Gossypium barbadense]|nr:hypothetical protein GOBAR_DD26954 [Gossypium barbadense]
MELVDDEDVETMVALYSGTRSNQNAPILLFAELASVEATEDPTPLGEEDGVQELCMVAPVSYIDSQSTIHKIDIDLNVAPETGVIGDDVYYSSDPVDHEVDSESDPDVDEVPDGINDEGVNEDENVNASSVGNQIRHIVIHNNPRAHMFWIDPDAARIAEFSEYPEIILAHRMAVYSDPKELFVGQRFKSKKECVFAIKRVLEIGRRLQLTDTSCINPEVTDIAAMREHGPGTVIELQTRPYYGLDDQPLGVSVYHRDPFTASSTLRLTSNEIIRIQTGRDKLLATLMPRMGQQQVNQMEGCNGCKPSNGEVDDSRSNLMPRMGQQQVNQMEVGHVFVEDVRDAMVANRRMARSMIVEVYSRRIKRLELQRPSVVNPVYHLGPTELISETGSATCTPSDARCVYGKTSSSCFLTYVLGRYLRRPSSLSQTKGCIGTRKVIRNHPKSIMKLTLERNPTGNCMAYAD